MHNCVVKGKNFHLPATCSYLPADLDTRKSSSCVREFFESFRKYLLPQPTSLDLLRKDLGGDLSQGWLSRTLSHPLCAELPSPLPGGTAPECQRMTRDQLQAHTRKDLAKMARDKGVANWHTLRKDDLIAALEVLAPAKKARKKRSSHAPVQAAAARNTSPETVERSKFDVGIPTLDLSPRVPRDLPTGYGKDAIVAMVRDPFWIHCYWEITPGALQRAEAALDHEWHTARPILRVLDVTSRDVSSVSEQIVRDIEIHGGSSNWYIDVPQPPRSYRIDIGYLSRNGRFYVIARSNVVTPPRAGMSDVIDETWADLDEKEAERIYAMSSGYEAHPSSIEIKNFLDQKVQRPIGAAAITALGASGLSSPMGSFGLPGHGARGKKRSFWFQLDAELIVYGATEPAARVTLQGQPVTLRPDGTFTMRFKLPDNRQIIKAVATSPDGIEDRTIILAVERNTRALPPMIRDDEE